MYLRQLLQVYTDAHPYGIRKSSQDQIRYSIGAFDRYLGRAGTLDDLTPQSVNRWIDYLLANRSPDTVRSYRGAILTIWKFAAEELELVSPPTKVRKLRPVRKNPEAWLASEIDQVIRAIDKDKSFPNGIGQLFWTRSLVLTAYDTAIRLGDLLAARWHQMRAYNSTISFLTLTTSKTCDPIIRYLNEETTLAIKDYKETVEAHPNDLIWPLWGRREAFFYYIRKLVARSGVNYGSFKYLRRAAVTQADIAKYGNGQRIAGHKSPNTTNRSYRDARQLEPSEPMVPPLSSAIRKERYRQKRR